MPDAAPAATLTPKRPEADLQVVMTDEKVVVQGPARLAWRRFRRHRPGMFGLVVLVVLYLMAIFADFISPYHYTDEARDLMWAPPTVIRFSDAAGSSARPFIHPFRIDI